MKQTVIIYESKYGFTERYAKWIAESLSCPIFERKSFCPKDFKNFNTIIYGGGLYANSVNGIKLLTQNFQQIRSKNIILFTCGLTDPNDSSNIDHIHKSLTKVLSPEMLDTIHLFHLQGGIDYARLNFIHKSMMAMLRKMLSQKPPEKIREEDKQLLATYGKMVDFTNRDTIMPIVDCTLGTGRF